MGSSRLPTAWVGTSAARWRRSGRWTCCATPIRRAWRRWWMRSTPPTLRYTPNRRQTPSCAVWVRPWWPSCVPRTTSWPSSTWATHASISTAQARSSSSPRTTRWWSPWCAEARSRLKQPSPTRNATWFCGLSESTQTSILMPGPCDRSTATGWFCAATACSTRFQAIKSPEFWQVTPTRRPPPNGWWRPQTRGAVATTSP